MPVISFWHGKMEQLAGSGHHLLAITLHQVWTCAVNRQAKGIRAPYQRLPVWLFSNIEFMTTIADLATSTLANMSLPDSSITQLWDKFYGSVPDIAKRFILSTKRQLIKKGVQLVGQDANKPKIKKQLDDLDADWEIIDPDPNSAGHSDCGIAGARDGPNMVYTDPKSILTHVHKLFSEKFEKRKGQDRFREKSTREWMKHAPRKISEADSEELEQCITKKNIIRAMDSMKKDAAPNDDGIPLPLFTHELTKEVMADILVLVGQDAMKKGRLPDTLRKEVIRLLQKEGKDNTDILAGKRPISLMSIALRILAKCIATALSPFMDSWIGPHQKAYVRGRRIEVNTAIMSILIQNAQDLTREDLQFLMLLEVDFRSAFDTVDHDFIKALLTSIGIGENITRLIMLIVGTLEASVIVNSLLTLSFKIKRGVPQGCSLSGILFILVLECIFNKAFAYPDIYGKGVALLRESQAKVSDTAFADDVNIPVTQPEPLCAWVELFQDFNCPSGLTINEDKTQINLLGHGFFGSIANEVKRTTMISKLRILCPALQIVIRQDVKTVGTIIAVADFCRHGGKNDGIMNKSWIKRIENFIPRLLSLRFQMAGQPVLSKIPKINNNLSSLWYLSLNCPITEAQVSTIWRALDYSVWEYGSPLLKRSIYTQPVSVPGGIGAPDPGVRIQALQATWVRLLMTGMLPKCLEEYFIDQIISVITYVTRETVNVSSPVEVVDILLELYASPNQLIAVKKYYEDAKKQLFIPLFQAFNTIHQLPEIPESLAEWGTLTTKKIYESLQITLNSGEVPSGQVKWMEREQIDIDWPLLWQVVASLKSHFKDLHDALYNIIIRRPVVVKKNDAYSVCPYCSQSVELWSPVHAIFNCCRIKPVWKHVGMVTHSEQPVSPSIQQVFRTCQQIPTSKSRRQPKMSLIQLLILCTLTEIYRWVKGHIKDGGEFVPSDASLRDDEFRNQMLHRIWLRVSLHRSKIETASELPALEPIPVPEDDYG